MLRKLLFPFSVLFDAITSVRNFLYNKQIIKSTFFENPKTIVVGNLAVGGTGKSPHVMFLAELLKEKYKLSFLSRGYGRKSKGFLLADKNATAENIGDEPLQAYLRFAGQIPVAVCEKRVLGVQELKEKVNPEIVLLDDAFQHRALKPNFSIVLTTYQNLFYKDFILPAGNLRESKRGIKRADAVIVTKCPKEISQKQKKEIAVKVKVSDHQSVWFSFFEYSDVLKGESEILLESVKEKSVVLVTGIAKADLLEDFLVERVQSLKHLCFGDHHHFSQKDIERITSEVQKLENAIIVTTEKDYMRLKPFEIKNLYYLPIEVKLDRQEEFENWFLKEIQEL